MFLKLVATVCLVFNEGECKKVEFSYESQSDNVTPQQCMMIGQVTLSKWRENNPLWKVNKFNCNPHKFETF